jgi:hypothetical protein
VFFAVVRQNKCSLPSVMKMKASIFWLNTFLRNVCDRCGERTYSSAVTDELLKFAKDKFKPVKRVEVPVFDFAESC